jgi:hypothetical protein
VKKTGNKINSSVIKATKSARITSQQAAHTQLCRELTSLNLNPGAHHP